jgi:hypothetical protein
MTFAVINATKRVADLSSLEREQMLQLMDENYLGVESTTFATDLAEKDDVLMLLAGDSGAVVGFSTVMVLDLAVGDDTVKAVFSGDTIVAADYRRTPGLGIELAHYLVGLLDRFPDTAIHWILISKGCRTYRLLPFFFTYFSPAYDHPTPARHQAIRDAFGAKKYPQEYDPSSGLIHYRGEPQRLRPGVADATTERLSDPHIRFFVEANPNHMAGDDLVCVAEVAEANFTRGFRRLLQQPR